MTQDEAFRVAVAAVCPHTDCRHENTYRCSGWSYAQDVFDGLHAAGFRVVRAPRVNAATAGRIALVRNRLESGTPLPAIAEEVGMSYTALRGLMARHGLSGIARRGRTVKRAVDKAAADG